jgi:hypothetical protein
MSVQISVQVEKKMTKEEAFTKVKSCYYPCSETKVKSLRDIMKGTYREFDYCEGQHAFGGSSNGWWCSIAIEAGLEDIMTYPVGNAYPTEDFFEALKKGALRLKRNALRRQSYDRENKVILDKDKPTIYMCGRSLDDKLELLRNLWRAAKRAKEVDGIICWS